MVDAEPSENSVINWKQGEIDYMDRKTFIVIIGAYADKFHTSMVEIRDFYEAENWHDFERVVHNVKTGVGSIKCDEAFKIANPFLIASKQRKTEGVVNMDVEEHYRKFIEVAVPVSHALADLYKTPRLELSTITPNKLAENYIQNTYFPSTTEDKGKKEKNLHKPTSQDPAIEKNEIKPRPFCGGCECTIF
mmetsp:Transcript_62450/g.71636  ORF Transcript_62450/g.71636 Transcript_62450/m.71636 type:complete len:191 (+) Transcript_62450:120-692(+)|eukprot:CAMPEP_0115000536 /NCGR_PEP_ID=MMETSP0216-20121206/16820_1 /TAXON_ID=223996 /ORGANISM="Protocruzia adherens, Strain Boccale" /LENGTH=190 /DNA_ID=CAMNT_0002365661 /DNA_START=102 /DNA_END=674 /DNA_ORIENTATION=-